MKQKQNKAMAELLRLQAELLCDSHSASVQEELVQRLFCTVMRLLPKKQAKKAKRRALHELFVNSAYDGVPTVIATGDSIFLNGAFDVDLLCSQIVWKSTIQTVDLTEDDNG